MPASRPTTSASSSSPLTCSTFYLHHAGRAGGGESSWGFDPRRVRVSATPSRWALVSSTGAVEHALVVGADVMSSIIDYTDRSTCILFGDGAGAAVLSPAIPGGPAIIDFLQRSTAQADRRSRCRPAAAAADFAQDRRPGPPLRQAGRSGGVPIRREEERGNHAATSSWTWILRIRPIAASSSDGRPPWAVGREGGHQSRHVEQHDGGDDSAGAGRCAPHTEGFEDGRSGLAGVGRGRIYGRIDVAAVESL